MIEGKTDWANRAEGGYENLGWVTNTDLLQRLVDLAELQGGETVVDIGTGSQAVLNAVAAKLPDGIVYGFDTSPEMMVRKEGELPQNARLFVADATKIPLTPACVDVAFARMVYHHLPLGIIPVALQSTERVLKPGGRFLICEYVAPQNAWDFERGVFDIKEPERNLWTEEELKDLIQKRWNGPVRLEQAILGQYSVRDWLTKSGLSQDKQDQILALYLNAPDEIRQAMNINYQDGDALVDRPFAYVIASRNHDEQATTAN